MSLKYTPVTQRIIQRLNYGGQESKKNTNPPQQFAVMILTHL